MNELSHDLPFIYGFTPSGLTSSTLSGLNIQTDNDGASFFLRRIFNTDAAFTKFRLRQRSGAYASDNFVYSIKDQAIAPQVEFKSGDVIQFDAVGLVSTDCEAMIGFQGVRRYPNPINYTPRLRRWREQTIEFVSSYSFTVPVATACGTTLTRISKTIPNYDFALRRIWITNADNGVAASGQSLVRLYDCNQRALSNQYIPDYFITANGSQFMSLFPIPEIVYPAGSDITLNVSNFGTTEGEETISQQVVFDGVWRIPC